jgi:UDP-N-acetylmuramate dehydrogenase
VTGDAIEALDDALAFLGDRLRREEPIGPLTTYGVGGPARRFLEVADADELAAVSAAVAGLPEAARPAVLVIGRGSNLLVADDGADALVLQLSAGFAEVTISPGRDGASRVRAGGAANLPVVARQTVAAGLRGFEWAVGVPGSIGGAVRMNAGGHGSDMAASLVGVRVVDVVTGEDGEMSATSLDLGYRTSALRPEQVVVWADLELDPGDVTVGERELSSIVRWRRGHQPGGHNAGSVFANPAGTSAGRLIDEAGARGLRLGTAEVSPKHANFIQSDDGGSADDVFALMVRVAAIVQAHSGVRLHPETRLIGFPDFDASVAAFGDEAAT